MTADPADYLLSALLFALGLLGVLVRRNTLVVYMCLELMLLASTLALVAFSKFNGTLDGNVFVFFIL
ncbi:MAG: NADH-quinone oxidoreductase subunit NuoK, partial [Opitutaceae bacterium]|nr:NADH-quinone oxidoreductase subunit NuoK [Opitutaceae bacterium]